MLGPKCPKCKSDDTKNEGYIESPNGVKIWECYCYSCFNVWSFKGEIDENGTRVFSNHDG